MTKRNVRELNNVDSLVPNSNFYLNRKLIRVRRSSRTKLEDEINNWRPEYDITNFTTDKVCWL